MLSLQPCADSEVAGIAALAIAATLSFGLTDLAAPATDIDTYMSDVRRLMDESREALLNLLRSVDKASDVLKQVNREPKG